MSRTLSTERKKGNKLRSKILERDGYSCRLCGSDQDLEVHHMQALFQGGKSTEDNLITLCMECHAFAPEDNVKSNERYLKERNKVIYEQMMQSTEINSMTVVFYVEFLKERVDEYVKLGFIDEQQMNFILMYEINKLI